MTHTPPIAREIACSLYARQLAGRLRELLHPHIPRRLGDVSAQKGKVSERQQAVISMSWEEPPKNHVEAFSLITLFRAARIAGIDTTLVYDSSALNEVL